jgi:hypothetical protein
MSLATPRWADLFRQSVSIIAQAEQCHALSVDWTFGGGTALMVQIAHRDSFDVDIFVDDPQILNFLNPETQDYQLEMRPNEYHLSGHHALKLAFGDMGQIDFICAAAILEHPAERADVLGHVVAKETPSEIVAKKIVYRGSHIQPRDLFDIAAVARHMGPDRLAAALGPVRSEAGVALERAQRLKPAAVESVLKQLQIYPDYADLCATATDEALAVLRTCAR